MVSKKIRDGTTGRIIIFKGWRLWTGIIWLKIGASGWLCEHGNKPSGSVKGGGGDILTS
jgi:hypothetical protein